MRPLARHLLRPPTTVCLLTAVICLLFSAGCSSISRRAPGRTVMEVQATTLPARVISNFFVVESRWDDGRTYRFIVDTGSSTSYVSADLARRFAEKEKKGAPPRTVRVRSAGGGEVDLPAVTLRRLTLGASRFERVPALIYDFADLSGHLGLPIDGIIGFPVFRNTLVTLDYPGAQLILAPHPALPGNPAERGVSGTNTGPAAVGNGAPPTPAPRTATLAFNLQRGTPLIPVQMGNESFFVLIDSGSDGSLSLNPAGLHPRFVQSPRRGTLISTLEGDRLQLTGRITQPVLVGPHTIERPILDLTDQLSSLGGELLRHFTLTFDQRRNLVTFTRDTDGPITMEARRHTGLSFARSAVYWRVLSVIPDTPTAALPVQAGDLCVRINGEPVEKWGYERYAALLKTAAKITCTFLTGAKELDVEVPIFELVP
ncbi:MAG: aspartyl protease family protein [Opitutae bacterium]|nr:aspartyl protease family protein [Opitutae bacterium]